jgi:hypothetical protein
VAISNSRIIGVAGRRVVFRYKKQKSSRWRTLDLDALELIRRYLQHLLPAGFMKIRYYGFLGSGSTVTLDDVRTVIERSLDTLLVMPKYLLIFLQTFHNMRQNNLQLALHASLPR